MRSTREELGPYRIVRKIAVGGMAEIYLARQRGIEGLERTVVLKQILEKHEQNEEFVTMFLDEARLMAALSHPNIAQVFDLARADDTHYLVMEYVRGPTLGAMLSAARDAGQRGLPEKPALGIVLAVAEALHYVHERRDDLGRPLGIVHRDLNPSNVVVSYDGAVKLIDFGIAKAATKVYETRTGVIKGTYGYIAPEALTGSAQIDRRADVFALGILLYEMLVGKHPFDVSDEPNLLSRILEARYKRPREVRPDLPVALDRVIARCLAPHPEGRPESMQTLIDELAAHMARAGLVPTQLDLADVARRLVPDAEGPQPLRRPTAVKPRPVFPRETAPKDGGTRKVPTNAPATIEEPLPEDPEDPTHRIPPLPDAEPEPDAGGTRKIAAPPSEPRASRPPEPRAAGSTSMRASTPPGPRPSAPPPPPAAPAPPAPAPTTIPETPGIELAALELDGDEHGATVPAPTRLARPTEVETTARLPPSQARRGVHPLLGALGLLVAGAAAFAAARALGGRPPEPEVGVVPPVSATIPGDAGASGAIHRALHVVSEPPGAAVALDGIDLGVTTPAVIAVDARITHATIEVSHDGYATQSRDVSTSVPEARFVLVSVSAPDAGITPETAPDAGVTADPEPVPRRRIRRRRR